MVGLRRCSPSTVRRSPKGCELAYVREGVGGYPLLLVHGYPETKRIWWRNIEPLAAAGFEVIVPDLRGYGDSDLAPDGFYDPAALRRDLYTLVHDVLGHERVRASSAATSAASSSRTSSLRFPGFVDAPVLLQHRAADAGRRLPRGRHRRPTPTGRARPDGRLLPPPGRRRRRLVRRARHARAPARYIADFYGHRLWAAPGTFTPDDVDFMTEPFADAEHLRASWGGVRGGIRHAAALGRAPPVRDERRADARALRPRGPRRLAQLPSEVRGRVHRTASDPSSSPAPATSSSGSGPTYSTTRCATSSPICVGRRQPGATTR